jgi:hypothetical protein
MLNGKISNIGRKELLYMLYNNVNLTNGQKVHVVDNSKALTKDNLKAMRTSLVVEKTYESVLQFFTCNKKGEVFLDGIKVGKHNKQQNRIVVNLASGVLKRELIVWLLTYKTEIPLGMEIYHRNRNVLDDSPHNLEIREADPRVQYVIAKARWQKKELLPDDYEIVFRDGDLVNHDFSNYQMVLRGTRYLLENSRVTGVITFYEHFIARVYDVEIGKYSSWVDARKAVVEYVLANMPIRRRD